MGKHEKKRDPHIKKEFLSYNNAIAFLFIIVSFIILKTISSFYSKITINENFLMSIFAKLASNGQKQNGKNSQNNFPHLT